MSASLIFPVYTSSSFHPPDPSGLHSILAIKVSVSMPLQSNTDLRMPAFWTDRFKMALDNLSNYLILVIDFRIQSTRPTLFLAAFSQMPVV